MTHQRLHAYAEPDRDAVTDDDNLAPGRISRSAQLTGPRDPMTSALIQRKASDEGGVAAGADELLATAAGGSGIALPAELMTKFQSALGVDLSGVRVHTGGDSAAAAAAVSARAYTVGQDIHFGAGEFDPSSPGGEHLLAHEVAHTVQQRGAAPVRQNKLAVSGPQDADEHAADRAADAMLSGTPTTAGGAHAPPAAGAKPAEAAAAPGEHAPSAASAATATPPSAGAPAKRGPEGTVERAGGGASAAPAPAAAPGKIDLGATVMHGGLNANASAPAPAAQSAPLGTVRPVDGFVDHYMEAHWDRAEFDTACQELGYPDNAPTTALSEIDRLLPTNTSPEIRAAISLGVAIGSGVLDAAVMGSLKAAPILGIAFSFIDGARQGLESFDKYGKLNDSFGQWVSGARAALDTAASIADNLAGLASIIESAAAVVAGIATLTVAGAPVAAVAATVMEAAKVIKLVLQAVSANSSLIKAGLDVVLFVHNTTAAKEAEAHGDAAAAAKHRDLAQGNVIDAVGDTMAWLTTFADAAMGVILPTAMGAGAKIGSQIINKGAKSANTQLNARAKDLAKTLYKGGKGAVALAGSATPVLQTGAGQVAATGNVRQNVTGLGGTLGEIASMYNNTLGQVGLGDEMLVDDKLPLGYDYVDRKRASGGEGEIAAARTQTAAMLDTDEQGLETGAIPWYQQLLNEIVQAKPTDAGDVAQMMTPSGLIRAALGQVPALLGKLSADDLAALASGVESMAGSVQSVLGPAMTHVSSFIQEVKPHLHPILEGMSKQVTQSELNVTRIREILDSLQQGTSKVQEWTAPAGQIDATVNGAIAALAGAKVTRAKLGVPEAVPDALIAPAIQGANAPIGAAEAALRALKTKLVDQVRAWIAEKSAWFQSKVTEWQQMFQENSQFVQALRAAHEKMKQLVARATEAFIKWDGQIKIDLAGAGAWLHQIGAAARKAKEVEQKPEAGGDGKAGASWPAKVASAQQWIDGWKTQNAPRVESQYHPKVPPHEIAAVTAYYQGVKARVGGRPTPSLDQAYAACMQFAGQQGREALYGLWEAENRLVAAAHALDGKPAAGPPGGTAGAGGSPPQGTGGAGGSPPRGTDGAGGSPDRTMD